MSYKCLQCPDNGGLPPLKGYLKGKGLCAYHQALAHGWTKEEAFKMFPNHPCVTYNNLTP